MSLGHTRCVSPIANLHAEPDARTECVSQCLFGEQVEILSTRDAWREVRGQRDGYVGWLMATALARDGSGGGSAAVSGLRMASTHVVSVPATLLFSAPHIKSPVRARVPLGAELSLDETECDAGPSHGPPSHRAGTDDGSPFARVMNPPIVHEDDSLEAYVWRAHCRPLDRPLDDPPVALARRLFTGTPYLWGGRTPDGVDCSGLVQAVAFALGHALPRDSGDQERALPHVVAVAERAASDLVFWPGHVGLLIDAQSLFHATAHSLSSVAEPLANVIARAGPPSSIRRLPTNKQGAGQSVERKTERKAGLKTEQEMEG